MDRLEGGPEAPSTHVGRSEGGACRDPCLCLDFKGSWALLKLMVPFVTRTCQTRPWPRVLHIRTLPVGAEVSCTQSEMCPSEGWAAGTGVV